MSARFSSLRKYLSFFRIRFSAGLQYRAAALAGIATQFAWGFFEILMFEAFWRTDPGRFPMERSALYSYIWLQQGLLTMFMLWIYDDGIFSAISDGGVALELCRPADIYTMWFVRNCSMRLSRVVLRCFPIFIFAALLPEPYSLRLPKSPSVLAISALSMIVGFIVLISISMLVYISAFHTLDSRGTKLIAASVGEFCAGGIIPLPFLPDTVRKVIELLPFAATQSTPFLIFGGTLTGRDALSAIALQVFWAVTLIIAGRIWMRTSLKRVILQGG